MNINLNMCNCILTGKLIHHQLLPYKPNLGQDKSTASSQFAFFLEGHAGGWASCRLHIHSCVSTHRVTTLDLHDLGLENLDKIVGFKVGEGNILHMAVVKRNEEMTSFMPMLVAYQLQVL